MNQTDASQTQISPEEPLLQLVNDLNTKAENLLRQDAYHQSIEIAQSARALANGSEPSQPVYPLGAANALITIAYCYTLSFQYRDSISLLKKAVQLLSTTDSARLRCTAYLGLGSLYNLNGDTSTAISYSQRSIFIAEQNDLKFELVDSLITHSGILYNVGAYDDAEAALIKAQRIAKELNDQRLVSGCLNNLANVYLVKGKIKQAEATARSSLALSIYPARTAYVLDTLGQILIKKGDLLGAAECFQQAIDNGELAENPSGVVESYMHIAELFIRSGNYAEAERNLRKSLQIAEKTNTVAIVHGCHQLLAVLYDALGEPAKAYEHFKKFHDFSEKMRQPTLAA